MRTAWVTFLKNKDVLFEGNYRKTSVKWQRPSVLFFSLQIHLSSSEEKQVPDTLKFLLISNHAFNLKQLIGKHLFNDLSKFYNINNCNFCFLSNRQFWIERAGLKAREITFRIEGIISLLHHCSSTIPTKTYPLSLTDRTFGSRAPFWRKVRRKIHFIGHALHLTSSPLRQTSLQ